MRCNNFVVVGILAAYVACVFESRIVWPDAVLLTVLSPLGIIQTVMGMTNFMPDIAEVRKAHFSRRRNRADEKIEGIRALLSGVDTLRFKFASPEVRAFKERANITEMRFPSSYDEGVDVEGIVIHELGGKALRPLIIFVHGGGMALGSANTVEAFEYANRFNATVISVEYRLAPEYPFPAGLNDVYDTLKWAISNAEALSIDSSRIVMAGTSGGGLLAAAVSHRAREEDLRPRIKAQFLSIPVLLYPGGHTNSYHEFMYVPGLGANIMMWFWQAYTTHPLGCRSTECSPLLSEDFSGLPPTIVQTAVADVLRDEGVLYAEKLEEAGVDVQHCMTPTSHLGATVFDTEERHACLESLRDILG